eukprot:TRINITY_DN1266_c0_g1_i2.p2 TRINITY_DN1266_c0_g1~~TRINITY_DN1266_c0_g1_i2.p2  ORF type:complete len:112 (-),score=8.99 TRINITY_DN1266_c0_g1_i2:171-506(-)
MLGATVRDARCYHMGGPLDEGDIEDFDGRLCVKCPWHRYIIDLDTGEGMYRDMESNGKCKGRKQRVHQVKEDEEGFLWIRVSSAESDGDKVESDHYCPKTEAEKRRMGLLK